MRHCSPDELMDVVDGTCAEVTLPHLTTCAACRQQLTELRAVLTELREMPVPEPSPAQWARLSARVRDLVAFEGERSRGSWEESWASWAWGLPVAAAVILTLAVAVPGLDRPAPAVAPSAAVPGTAGPDPSSGAARLAQPPADDTRDASLGLMFDLAGIVDLDSDPAPVLAMNGGALDEAVGELSPDEQHELARLLTEAMARPGA